MSLTSNSAINGVNLEILWSRLISIADEAATALRRTAFSTIVRESNDFAVTILDENAAAVAENTIGVPAFLGVLPRAVKSLLQEIPIEEWNEGDCIVTNDPWLGAGHLPDLVMASPIFLQGRLVGFCATVAHLPDIGGVIFSADCKDFFEEGTRILPTKFMIRGKENAEVARFIRGNVRLPDMVIRDIYAQVAAHRVVAQGVQKFLCRSGFPNLSSISQALHERADTAMRAAIAKLPDGEYRSVVTADGYDDKQTEIHCCIRIEGSNLDIDYTGTSPQIDRGLNSVFNYTYAYTVYPLKCALDPITPHNDGSYRSVTINSPLGSILNPRFPAPCNARQLTGQLLAGAIYKCLALIVPDKVIAESGTAPTLRAVFSGADDTGKRFSQMLMCSGGMGASAHRDGHSCTPFPTNTGSGSIEAFEGLAPLLVRRKELVSGSGGDGKRRGGLGQEVEIEVTGSAAVNMSLMADRILNPAQGLQGGGTGRPVSVSLASGRTLHPKARTTLLPGDRLTLRYGGGGGFGNPAERSKADIRNDIENDYITAAEHMLAEISSDKK
ncbi:hydantoinase B/oxoprolinase family protein [Phyllobacterium sophorae]|uniref:Hydantoin utilization protein B n=1 Tax=Phyllobacterium sophorae TaxID=1520277 RepID=A0A2P7B300_9HYPH|nr:hydantoinase B/oxoprolinase family protein [Phyllobacterium sophorae]PSH60854.1 hydantoin utilization protein B [Phyllobacterium sophorae]